ncbi:amidophosphoribosyltransferase [Alkaliphilus serpentinus]|uniref:Amidophosphoribosyltransferase n=1 Tax=Alkaliphilus serpentinus TaxID=1482731 RepID=A0A833HQN4_9FIRM|nr:amidophosphoribosyltransferase [Alkaliphilus serpentinus]KAB3532110.1 amidophosphoribosyltransferase [Alkaliphilus serpentinus]
MFNNLSCDKLKEECGVMGVYRNTMDDVAQMVYYGLFALQHRGQESAGIATNDGNMPYFHKGMGLVNEVFNDEIFRSLKGNIGIGHVRYSTTGESYINNAQPLVVKYRRGSIGLAHNGNLVNAPLIRSGLEDDGVVFQTTIDSEVIVNLIARYSSDGIPTAIERTMDLIKGAYSLVIMTEGELIGVRDPHGLRPLCIGKLEDGYVIASESCGLDSVGAELIRDVEPGEIVIINQEGIRSIKLNKEYKKASCIFEYIYFARPDSVIDGVGVYQARKNAGEILAKEHPVEVDMVIAVPDTSIPAAIGYSEALGIPFSEGFIKNRYIGRTFIQPDQSMRELAVRLKLNPLRSNIIGKRVVMIDDSIVRGTTSKQIVNTLKRAGAKEVHVRISSPPVAYSCYYGIDTPDNKQLIGAVKTIEEIRQAIGADSLGYISPEGLKRSVGIANDPYCTACFCGDYPLEIPLR